MVKNFNLTKIFVFWISGWLNSSVQKKLKMALSQVAHRSSALKQQNKKHNTLGHRSKGQLKAPKGELSLFFLHIQRNMIYI